MANREALNAKTNSKLCYGHYKGTADTSRR
jgi:hypothetical protein